MTKKFFKIHTGFTFLDLKWGGVYPGGNYLIYGSKKSGKTLLALKIIEHLTLKKINTLLITNEREKTLEIQSNSLYFDINSELENGTLQINRLENEVLNFELIETLVKNNAPSIMIFDDIFQEKIIDRDEYLKILKFFENNDITTFFIASIIDDEKSKSFLRLIAKNSTGLIQLKKNIKKNYSGTISIKPNVGHLEGEFETSYKVEPIKGFVTLADNENSILEFFSENTIKEKNKPNEDKFSFSNVYSNDEFELLTKSIIAQEITSEEKQKIIKYEILDKKIEPIELCNSIKTLLTDGDKITYSDRFVYVLPFSNDSDDLESLISNVEEKIIKLFNTEKEAEIAIKRSLQSLKPNFKIQ